MSSRYEEHDHDSYGRPQRRTRPRTKDRPSYRDATTARVLSIDRGRYTLLVRDGGAERLVSAMKARQLGRQGVVIGDNVRAVGDLSGAEGSLARIVEVEDRRTVLRRSADDDDPVERVLVANADQLVIVTALADPPPRPRLIDRCLVAAYDAGMHALLCLTKSDLASPDELLTAYRPLGVTAVAISRGGSLDEITRRLQDRVSVLVGHSGVGKSTLVNALVPDAARITRGVNQVTGRGRHASTSAIALRLSFGGWIIDTPGIRSFGLAHVEPDRVLASFGDLAAVGSGCPRGCSHTDDEPECELDVAVTDGRLDPARVESFRRLLASRERRED
ncbi:MAG: ribosome small subunit-dependent GTPase A [Nocardioidaceae bacterium]|nr:ribosome small subunit-dependent GTPase A [Nocardioidaceae bacterium]